MSIATEISRLQQAKAALKTAIEAKGVTVSSSDTIDDYATLVGQIQTGGGGGSSAFDMLISLRDGTKTTITQADCAYIKQLIETGALARFFASKMITSVDYSSITSIEQEYGFNAIHNGDNVLTSIDFSNLTLLKGTQCFANAFQNCTSLTSISFPLLETIQGTQCVGNAFIGCSSLANISFPSLNSISGTNPCISMFTSCSSIASATVHPDALKSSNVNSNILGSINTSTFTTLRLSATATDNVYLSWAGSLDSASILDVLNHLSTEATGKTCAFKNLTVASSDPNYAAISSKKTALTNWTITGLTI